MKNISMVLGVSVFLIGVGLGYSIRVEKQAEKTSYQAVEFEPMTIKIMNQNGMSNGGGSCGG